MRREEWRAYPVQWYAKRPNALRARFVGWRVVAVPVHEVSPLSFEGVSACPEIRRFRGADLGSPQDGGIDALCRRWTADWRAGGARRERALREIGK